MEQQIPPLLDVVDHYRSAGILATVDGRQPIEGVTRDVIAAAADGAPEHA
jgi:adenylate kinase family enzyme